jgi:hypothetical protein
VKFEQQDIGNPEFGCALAPIDFVTFAKACGADAYRCEGPEEVVPAIKGALESVPVILLERCVSLCGERLPAGQTDGGRAELFPIRWIVFVLDTSSANAMIRKLSSGKYRLYSRKKNPKTGHRRNLGTFSTRTAAEKHERAVQYYKRH